VHVTVVPDDGLAAALLAGGFGSLLLTEIQPVSDAASSRTARQVLSIAVSGDEQGRLQL
jgi:hypothetical protein